MDKEFLELEHECDQHNIAEALKLLEEGQISRTKMVKFVNGLRKSYKTPEGKKLPLGKIKPISKWEGKWNGI